MRALLVPVGDDTYAIELDAVREVLPTPLVTTIPTSPRAVVGVFNLRGEVVVLLDSGVLLGTQAGLKTAAVVVVDAAGSPVGLTATGPTTGGELGEEAGPGVGTGALGRYHVGSTVATLVDVPALLEQVRGEAA
jgi:purine-binding chemotaxis protein CheW